jgi:hypothetical protein
MWQNLIIVAWFDKNVYLSDEIWISLTRTGELNSHHQQSPMGVVGIHTMGCCPVPRRDHLFTTLLSPPQCHVAFGTMPHTLATVEQRPVCCPRTLSPSATRTPRVGFWRGHNNLSKVVQPLVHWQLVTVRRVERASHEDVAYIGQWTFSYAVLA